MVDVSVHPCCRVHMACTHLSYHACSSWLQHAHGVSLRLARVCAHNADDSMHVRSYVGLKAPGTQVTSSPRGHVVVVEFGVVAVVRAFLVVEAAAAGSGELLVVVAGAAAGVELLVAVAGAAAGVGSR